ncbi:MAG TPA: PIG-L family deacetylase, partial [Mycoplana sp.]|nr:PIG-L family deacetylase [Mycoplana sp.]
MLRDHERIAREMSEPALLRLHRKLERLSSILTVMNTGAHPDDEANGLLAAFRYGFGIRTVIACSTRGEGGQNTIGPERGAALGVLRTREMEESARVLDADVVWLGRGPDDPVHDFGFSKNGNDTLTRWGEDRIVERLVRAYREERPDIVIPTFLDVPGQHGHHRAMTRAAEIAIARAADPQAYPAHFAEGLEPWQVSKFYLPAWSGGGPTYDDETPPPRATLIVQVPGSDIATGVPFARIGEWSRAKHLSQGMGVWFESPPRSWPLHLLLNSADDISDETDIRDGLPATLGAMADSLSGTAASHLRAAQRAIEKAQAAFPHRPQIIEAAVAAARAIEKALALVPDQARKQIEHRLMRKLSELDSVIVAARNVHVRAWALPSVAAPGGKIVLHLALDTPDDSISVKPVLSPSITQVDARQDGAHEIFDLEISSEAPLTNPYTPNFRSLGGNGEVAVAIEVEVAGRLARSIVDLEEPLNIAPLYSLRIDPNAAIINVKQRSGPLSVTTSVEGREDQIGATLNAPADWSATPARGGIDILPPSNLAPGLYRLEGLVDGQPAYRSLPIAYPHIGRTAYISREELRILALEVTLPPATKIGYVGGGHDRVGTWLSRLGLDVTNLSRDDLQRDLSRFTTIVVGIFAFGTRPDLAAARTRLHRFVEAGGHLVTLYHRPTDGWDPAMTPPRRIEIGSPSLRWRVTDPDAPVDSLQPAHPLLARPNHIGLRDWSGWDKERGLYFASSWNEAYAPLLGMSDRGESPLLG